MIPTGIAHAGTTSDSHLGLALAHFLNPSAAAAIPPGPHIIHLPDPRQQAPSAAYCIPVNNKNSSFHVLAAGDSITQGSVPSRNLNYPYTIKLEELLRRKLGPKTRAMDAGVYYATAPAPATPAPAQLSTSVGLSTSVVVKGLACTGGAAAATEARHGLRDRCFAHAHATGSRVAGTGCSSCCFCRGYMHLCWEAQCQCMQVSSSEVLMLMLQQQEQRWQCQSPTVSAGLAS